MSDLTKYPLCWPHGKPRTARHLLERSNFKGTQDQNQRELMAEIQRLGGYNAILSTNIKLRQDGYPYASQKPPTDKGVAAYFTYKKKQMCFACDKWDKIQDNIRSIAKTIDALRGIERWGSSDMMEQAFTGFEALPPPENQWWDVLECRPDSSDKAIKANYRRLCWDHHPDRGGDHKKAQQINDAYRAATQR